MLREQYEIALIAALVAVACALPGCFLVLRRMALMSDAISHAILPGIVLAYFFTRNLSSPLLVLGAALAGVATVSLVELIHRTGLVREDAAIGLVFPVMFSIGVVLIARHFRNEHLDVDAVLKGNLVLSVLDRRLSWGGYDIGPQTLYVTAAVLLLNLLFIGLFYKELKLATFDPALAAALGFSPALIHYALMSLVSVTAVAAFDAVGAVLVVALMIGPPAAAYLLTDRLSRMLAGSAALGVVSALSGYGLARWLNASIAGSMAAMTGVLFGAVLVLAPEHGLLALAWRRRRQRWEFAQTMLAIHLLNHEGKPEAERENRVEHLHDHLQWKPSFAAQVVRRAERQGIVERRNGYLLLTPQGRQRAREAIVS
ncbi:MAG TPA: metal ABC transporter permease [Gemmataceae bacterium]|nr:metal ABC transporter permease [Gemmataceae bacterium]